MRYLHPRGTDGKAKAVSLVVVDDMGNDRGLQAAEGALRFALVEATEDNQEDEGEQDSEPMPTRLQKQVRVGIVHTSSRTGLATLAVLTVIDELVAEDRGIPAGPEHRVAVALSCVQFVR